MPDAELDLSGLPGASQANTSQTGGQVLTGYVQSFEGDAEQAPFQASAEFNGSPLFTTGIDTTVLQGGVSTTQTPLLQGEVGAGGITGGVTASPSPAPIFTTQAVKVDIRNTVVQPLEPCASAPYLQLTFRPVNSMVKFDRTLQRQTSIPFPKPYVMTVTDFKALFTGKVHLADPKYLIRWKQVLPVTIQPQDSGSLPYTSIVLYDIRTALLTNDEGLFTTMDDSYLPLTQISKAEDVEGGILNPDFQDYELELDQIVFVDIETSTGRLIGKDPVDAGIFTGP